VWNLVSDEGRNKDSVLENEALRRIFGPNKGGSNRRLKKFDNERQEA
jgi:hypothetical protein